MLLEHEIDSNFGIFLKSFGKLLKKEELKILKKGNIYRIQVKEETKNIDDLKNIMVFLDNLYNTNDLNQFNDILGDGDDDEKNKEKMVIFTRDINTYDIDILIDKYQKITNKKFVVDKNSFKNTLYDFFKNIFNTNFSIKDIINDNIKFIVLDKNGLSLKEKQKLKLIILLGIIFAIYYKKLKSNDFKYINRIDNFFKKGYQNYLTVDEIDNNFNDYLIKFVYNFIINLKTSKDIGKSKFLSVLAKVDVKKGKTKKEEQLDNIKIKDKEVKEGMSKKDMDNNKNITKNKNEDRLNLDDIISKINNL